MFDAMVFMELEEWKSCLVFLWIWESLIKFESVKCFTFGNLIEQGNLGKMGRG